MDPVNGFIELDVVRTFQDGWTIDPHIQPLRVSVCVCVSVWVCCVSV